MSKKKSCTTRNAKILKEYVEVRQRLQEKEKEAHELVAKCIELRRINKYSTIAGLLGISCRHAEWLDAFFHVDLYTDSKEHPIHVDIHEERRGGTVLFEGSDYEFKKIITFINCNGYSSVKGGYEIRL